MTRYIFQILVIITIEPIHSWIHTTIKLPDNYISWRKYASKKQSMLTFFNPRNSAIHLLLNFKHPLKVRLRESQQSWQNILELLQIWKQHWDTDYASVCFGFSTCRPFFPAVSFPIQKRRLSIKNLTRRLLRHCTRRSLLSLLRGHCIT